MKNKIQTNDIYCGLKCDSYMPFPWRKILCTKYKSKKYPNTELKYDKNANQYKRCTKCLKEFNCF